MNEAFQVGDQVEITNSQKQYSGWKTQYHKLGFKNPDKSHTVTDFLHSTCTITHIFQHPSQKDTVIAIKSPQGDEALIGFRGLKLVVPFKDTVTDCLASHLSKTPVKMIQDIYGPNPPAYLNDIELIADDCIDLMEEYARQELHQFWHWFRRMDDVIIRQLRWEDIQQAYNEYKHPLS